MKQVAKWLWRIRWAGRTTTGTLHYAEGDIKVRHPAAMRAPAAGTMILVEVLETPEKIVAAGHAHGRPLECD